MKVCTSVSEFIKLRKTGSLGRIGFVPTMGALHIGHGSLIERSVKESNTTILSIYVNPTQFDNVDDLANYPDKNSADLELAESLNVDVVLMPTYEQLYPDHYRYSVDENKFSQQLCGAHRQGHFTGVLTVVMKLLNIVRPSSAYFGEKDQEQLRLIEGMVDSFFLDCQVIGCDTVREDDGLALSSRNLNLTVEQRRKAPVFSKALTMLLNDDEVALSLSDDGFKVDYIQTIGNRRYGAVFLGQVRLIDNVELNGGLIKCGVNEVAQ